MINAHIGWTVSFLFWLIAVIIGRIADKHGDYETSSRLWSVEVVSLAAMWIFIGITHGWW